MEYADSAGILQPIFAVGGLQVQVDGGPAAARLRQVSLQMRSVSSFYQVAGSGRFLRDTVTLTQGTYGVRYQSAEVKTGAYSAKWAPPKR